MATKISSLLVSIRNHLNETTARYWSDSELTDIAVRGIHDLWRDIVDLKQEHYLTVDTTNVSMPANASSLIGVPNDVHKVYMIEPSDLSENGTNHGLQFQPLDYNDQSFQLARSRSAIDPQQGMIYYAVHQQGAPVGAPIIKVAPQVTSAVPIAFSYCPTLGTLVGDSIIPIPGEADNAVVSWTVAYARAKERDDRAPDPTWLAIYSTDKAHLLESLGLRQYQAPSYANALFEDCW